MRRNQIGALTLAATLVALTGLVSPRLPQRWHPFAQAAFGVALVRLTRAPLGLRPPELLAGLRAGAAAAAVAGAAVGVGTALPPVRAAMAGQQLPDRASRWLLLGIPVGTVWSEEAAFRAALGTVGAAAFGPAGGRLLQAVTFGLAHVVDARASGQSVPGTVLVTGVAGWVFGLLAERSGSLAAPMLAHLAVNEAGAVAAIAVQGLHTRRRHPRRARVAAPRGRRRRS